MGKCKQNHSKMPPCPYCLNDYTTEIQEMSVVEKMEKREPLCAVGGTAIGVDAMENVVKVPLKNYK